MTASPIIHHLHFTFGPVQSFVAQARRTRDLYAGSLLLSQLAIAAMRGARDAGGTLILPNFAQLEKTQSEHATAPNRFVASLESEAVAIAAGSAAKKAFDAAWQTIADAVWTQFLQRHAALGFNTEAIWQRQVRHFWNVAWVVTDADPQNSNALDRRKNWQTHWPQDEGGDHCVLMGQWQELSGFIRSKQRDKQDAFWQAVRDGIKSDLDLEPGERLCAIAFIKRFWKVETKGWPSTVTLAAVPWLRKIAATPAAHAAAKAHADLVKGEPGAVVASAQRVKRLREFPASIKALANLSGNFLNRAALSNKDDTPLRPDTDRKTLLDSLRALEDAIGDRAGNFYAVLLMDGDSMGALIRSHGAEKLTSSLTEFTTTVPGIIAEHDGITIYAGGDDLLALLPLDRALDAAIAAHQLYRQSFDSGIPATVSAAIVCAHYHCTFSRVLASAHELLDEVAKDKTGRDALAIRVLKPGGLMGEWSAPFEPFMKTAPHLFDPLVKQFGENKPLASSLLYNLRERFKQLTEGNETTADRSQLLKLFTAEAITGKRDRDTDAKLQATQAVMNQLLDVCEIVRRKPDGILEKTGRFTFDGPRLVKFLALDGKEGAE